MGSSSCQDCPFRCIVPFNCHDVCDTHLKEKRKRDATREARLNYLADQQNVIKGRFPKRND